MLLEEENSGFAESKRSIQTPKFTGPLEAFTEFLELAQLNIWEKNCS